MFPWIISEVPEHRADAPVFLETIYKDTGSAYIGPFPSVGAAALYAGTEAWDAQRVIIHSLLAPLKAGE